MMRRAFSAYRQKVSFARDSLLKNKKKKIKRFFTLGLTASAFMIYAKHFNNEVDVVFQDSEMMEQIVEGIPALKRVDFT